MLGTIAMLALTERQIRIAAAFLRYSWEPVHYRYRGLTAIEQQFCTSEEFCELARRVKEMDLEGK